MRPRPPLALVALAILASGMGYGEPTREDSRSRPATSQVPPAPPDSDLVRIRDIFRYADEYADEPLITSTPGAGPEVTEGAVSTDVVSPPPARSRLIGLVQRSGHDVAAVFIDGEVLLLGEGEEALGFTVIEIRGERVLLRDPEGNEETLELP